MPILPLQSHYDWLESFALKRGIERLHVEASEGARPLFRRKGFAVLERRESERRGVPIHNDAMAKSLARRT